MDIFVMLGTLIIVSVSFYFGYTFGKRERPQVTQTTEEEQRKAREFHQAFSNLMNYDIEKAMERRLTNG